MCVSVYIYIYAFTLFKGELCSFVWTETLGEKVCLLLVV